ncbi:MAG: hypothetical protein RLZZ21_286 [Planctomycetota bacterium]
MKLDRNTLFALIAAVAFGYWLAGDRSPGPRPPDRPVLTWLARAAKNLLWIAAFADPPPPAARHEARIVQAPAIGSDGYPVIDHARGL